MTIFAALNLKTKDYEDTNRSFVEVQAAVATCRFSLVAFHFYSPDKVVGTVSERGDDPGGYGVIDVGTDV